jgi:hypothetical protein
MYRIGTYALALRSGYARIPPVGAGQARGYPEAGRGLAFWASAAVVLGTSVGVPVALGGQAWAAVTPVIITGFAAAPVDGPTITYRDTAVAHTPLTITGTAQVWNGRRPQGRPYHRDRMGP